MNHKIEVTDEDAVHLRRMAKNIMLPGYVPSSADKELVADLAGQVPAPLQDGTYVVRDNTMGGGHELTPIFIKDGFYSKRYRINSDTLYYPTPITSEIRQNAQRIGPLYWEEDEWL